MKTELENKLTELLGQDDPELKSSLRKLFDAMEDDEELSVLKQHMKRLMATSKINPEANEKVDRLLTAAKEDGSAQQSLREVLVQSVQDTFEQLFIPGKTMKGADQQGQEHIFTTMVKSKPDESDPDDLNAWLERTHYGCVSDLLVPAEQEVWRRLEFVDASAIETPNDLWGLLRQHETLPEYSVSGVGFQRNVFVNTDWHDAYSPVEQSVLFTEGRFGKLLGFVDHFTDGFRYDTLQSLDDDVFCIPEGVQVWWEWETKELDQVTDLLLLHLWISA